MHYHYYLLVITMESVLQPNEQQVKIRMAAFAGMCRQKGMIATHQRTEIYRELARSSKHPCAETVFKGVRKRIPAISLDTVYRTLRLFESRGVISRCGTIEDKARFDANTESHLHFVCTQCGRVCDFAGGAPDLCKVPPEAGAIGTVESVHVEVRGRCMRCQKK